MFDFASLSHRSRKLNRSKSCRPRLEWMESRTLLSAVTWTGGAGDNNWDTPANWSTDSVPGSGDDVTIDIAANIVHSDDVTDSINSLTSTEPLTISGGTLSIASTSTIGGTLTIDGGTLTGAGEVNVSGLVTLTSGTLSGSSTLNANGGMSINPTTSQFNLDGRSVNNAAGQTATWTGEPSGDGTFSNIEASDGSAFNNLGTFVANGNATYSESGIGAASVFNNTGNLTLSPSALLGMYVKFNVPGGSVDLQDNSQLDLGPGTTTAAAFDIETNAELEIGQGFTFDTATTISGSGGLLNDGMVLAGNYTYTGSTTVNAGNLQVDGSLAGSAVDLGDSGDTILSGTGTVGAISVGAGEVSPGDMPDPGILNVDGDVQFVAVGNDTGQGSIYNVVLNGPTAGAGYSQLNVSGQVDLGGSDFNATLGFTPTAGEQFTIIKSTVPIVGTFGGLPEGASLTIGNTPFTISYIGGDGNDVVLTAAAVTAAPAVAGISPNSGPDAGGTLVTITGTGFTGATAVDFGTTAATNVTVVNNTMITADSPAGSGVVDVTVITPAGRSAISAADQFTYTAGTVVVAAPTVTGVSPNSGPTAGGTTVTIAGTNFTGATAVDFGTTPATDVVVVNRTTITAVSPAGAGVAEVTVITPAGASATTSADQFTYIAPSPTVDSLKRFGFHMHPTSLVLTFSSALDPTPAEDVNNYQIVTMGGRGRNGDLVGHVTPVRAAVYDPASLTVTLYPSQRLDFHNVYRLTVDGGTPKGLMGATGVPLDSQGTGTPGRDDVMTLTWRNLVLPSAQARKFLHPKVKPLDAGRSSSPSAHR
jgi:autotransporter-associated beta strand protein